MMKKCSIVLLFLLLPLFSCAGLGESSGIKIPVELFTEVGEIAAEGAAFDADGNGTVENEEFDSWLQGLFLRLLARFGTPEFGQPMGGPTVEPGT